MKGHRRSGQDRIPEGQLPSDPRAVQSDLATPVKPASHSMSPSTIRPVPAMASPLPSPVTTPRRRSGPTTCARSMRMPLPVTHPCRSRMPRCASGSAETGQVTLRDADRPSDGLHEPWCLIQPVAGQHQSMADLGRHHIQAAADPRTNEPYRRSTALLQVSRAKQQGRHHLGPHHPAGIPHHAVPDPLRLGPRSADRLEGRAEMPSQCSLWPIQVTKAHSVIVLHQQRNRKTWFRGRCSRRPAPSTRRGGAWISRGRGSPDRTRFTETQSTEYEPLKPDENIHNLT